MADIKPIVAIGDEPDIDEILQAASQVIRQHESSNKSSPPSLTGTAAPTSEEDDNMDFDSDDDDDSKSNHSNSNNNNINHSNRKKRLKGEIKRSHHNVLERKRRDLIKDSFTKLRDAVPTLSGERASRAQILKKAADFIQLTHQRNESTKADIRELEKKNSELENKIGNVVKVKEEPQPNNQNASNDTETTR